MVAALVVGVATVLAILDVVEWLRTRARYEHGLASEGRRDRRRPAGGV